MRSTHIFALASLAASTVTAGNIGFGISTDVCGDGFYVGCTSDAGECCNLPTDFTAQSVSFYIGPNTDGAVGRAFNRAGCTLADRVAENPSNDQAEFCIRKIAQYNVTSAHFAYSGAGTAAVKRNVGGGSVRADKACRDVDHLVFPGGARADIAGLGERELGEVLDVIVARGDVAAVEARIAALRK